MSILFCVYYDFLHCEFIYLNFQQAAHQVPEQVAVSSGESQVPVQHLTLTPAKPPTVRDDNPFLRVREALGKEEGLSFYLDQWLPTRGDSLLPPSGDTCLGHFGLPQSGGSGGALGTRWVKCRQAARRSLRHRTEPDNKTPTVPRGEMLTWPEAVRCI